MHRFRTRRPSAGMAVAFVALLAAVSGTAVALPGTNSVNSGDIKNGSVKSADIENNGVRGRDIRSGAVRGSDIAANAVKGADVDEGSLGTVPAADAANTANSATTAGTAANSVHFAFRLTDGQTKDIASSGGLTLTAACDNDVSATLDLTTSADNAAMYADNGDIDADFDVADGAKAVDEVSGSGPVFNDNDNPLYAVNAAGTSGMTIGSVGLGVNLANVLACTFIGVVDLM